MTIYTGFAALGRLFDYPAGKAELLANHDIVSTLLEDAGAPSPTAPFAAFVTVSSLAEIEEEYVATFDFNPATAPYLGHHLFGDHREKAGYMVGLKREYDRHGFVPPGNDLPDHLPVVLGFLAHLAQREGDDARRRFIAESVMPGMERLSAAFTARRQSPWGALVDAARLLCTRDSAAVTAAEKEVESC